MYSVTLKNNESHNWGTTRREIAPKTYPFLHNEWRYVLLVAFLFPRGRRRRRASQDAPDLLATDDAEQSIGGRRGDAGVQTAHDYGAEFLEVGGCHRLQGGQGENTRHYGHVVE